MDSGKVRVRTSIGLDVARNSLESASLGGFPTPCNALTGAKGCKEWGKSQARGSAQSIHASMYVGTKRPSPT
jgi:hypothetical protein